MSNKIFNDTNAMMANHYCHAFEGTKELFEATIEALIDECGDKYTEQEYIEFFQSMAIYYFVEDGIENKEAEKELYDFSVREYIEGTL